MCERVLFPATCSTLKILKTMWRFFYVALILLNLIKITAVQKSQQYFPYYCKTRFGNKLLERFSIECRNYVDNYFGL